MGCLFASRSHVRATPRTFRPFLIGIVLALSLSLAPRAHAAIVDLDDIFSLDILLGEDVLDLYAYQFGITFDPTILSANSVSERTFLSSAGETFFIPGFIDNTLGLITFNANTLLSAIPGASGRGALFSIQFTALSFGTTTVAPIFDELNGDALLDSSLNPFSAAVFGDTVEVRQPAASVPEPGTLLLVGVGAAALAVRRKAKPRIRFFATSRTSGFFQER